MAENDVKISVVVVGEDQVASTFKKIGSDGEKAGNQASKSIRKLTDNMTASILKANLYGKAIGYITSTAVRMAKSHLELEKSMAKVNTLMGVGRDTLNQYSLGLEDIGIKARVSTQELSEGLYEALSAGVEMGESLEFMETSAMLARAGFTSVTTSVDALTTVINAWGKSTSDANDIADIFVQTQANGKLTVDEMGQSIANVAPLASALGVSFEEVSASLATMTAQGIPASQAVTQMRSALSELSKDSSIANKELQEMTGKTFQELQREGKSVNDVILLLQERSNQTGKSLNNMFGSVEAGGFALATAGKNATDYAKNLKDIENASGEMEKAHEQATDNLTDNWGKFVELMEQKINPIFKLVTDTSNELIKAINENIEAENNLKKARELNGPVMEAYERRLKIATNTYGTYSEQANRAREELNKFVYETVNADKIIKESAEARQKEQQKRLDELMGKYADNRTEESSKTVQEQAEARIQAEKEAEEKIKQAREEAEKAEDERLEEVRQKNIKDLEEYNRKKLEEELKFTEMLLELKEEDFEKIQELEREQELKILEADINFYNKRELMDEEHINARLKLQQFYLKERKNLDEEEEDLMEKHLANRQAIDNYSVAVSNATYEALVQGRIKNLNDFINVLASELTATLASKAIEHSSMGFSDLALALYYKARMMEPMVPVAMASAKENFAVAAKFGAGAGAVGGLAGATGGIGATEGDSSTSSPETPTGGDETVVDDIVDEAGTGNKTVIIQGVDWLLEMINKESIDKYNKAIIE